MRNSFKKILSAVAVPLLAATLLLAPPASAAPRGTIKLPPDRIEQRDRFVCGKIGERWLPGVLLKTGDFYPHETRIKSLSKSLRKAAPNKRAKIRRQIASLRKLLPRQTLACASRTTTTPPTTTPTTTAPTTTAPTTTPPTPTIPTTTLTPPTVPTTTLPPQKPPVRFDLSGAHSLFVEKPLQRATRGGALLAASTTPSSNLRKIDAGGGVSESVISGEVVVRALFFSRFKEQTVYLLFPPGGVDLGGGALCALAEVRFDSAEPLCLERGETEIAGLFDEGSGERSHPLVQFDQSGAVYYPVRYNTTTREKTVALRRIANRTPTDIFTLPNLQIRDYLVLPDGEILLRGSVGVEPGTIRHHIQRLSPDGSLQTLFSGSSFFIHQFPDRELYFGAQGSYTVRRYLLDSRSLEEKQYLAHPWSGAAEPPLFSTEAVCGSAARCTNFPSPRHLTTLSTQRVFGVTPGSEDQSVLMEYYPSPALLPTQVKFINLLRAGSGAEILIAGKNAAQRNILTVFNTANNSELELLGAQNEVEIAHLNYREGERKVLFNGLVVKDRRYVLGECDLTQMSCRTLAQTRDKGEQLEAVPPPLQKRYRLCLDTRVGGSPLTEVEVQASFQSSLESAINPPRSTRTALTCFESVIDGASYSLTPKKDGSVFSPPILTGTLTRDTVVTATAQTASSLCGSVTEAGVAIPGREPFRWPISGITIELRANPDGPLLRDGTTDSSGSYCFSIATGTPYSLTATDPNGRYRLGPQRGSSPTGTLTENTTVNFEPQ